MGWVVGIKIGLCRSRCLTLWLKFYCLVTHTTLYATCDNNMRVYLDGVVVHEDRDWGVDTKPLVSKEETEISIPSGTQVIGIECKDNGGQYGILASTVTDSATTDGIFHKQEMEMHSRGVRRMVKTRF